MINLTQDELRTIGYNKLRQFPQFEEMDSEQQDSIVTVFCLGMQEMAILDNQATVLENHFKKNIISDGK